MDRSNRGVLQVLSGGLLAALVVVGCKCEGPGFQEIAPDIVAAPNPIVFDRVPVNEEITVRLLIQNDGNAPLTLDDVPSLSEDDGDGLAELILRASGLPVNCLDGSERADDTPLVLDPGQCVSAEVVYLPRNLGSDTGSIVVTSDDPDTPTLVIPIDAAGAAPDIEVCAVAGPCVSEEICNDAGPVVLAFPLAQINSSTLCDLRITNRGDLPLRNLDWTFSTGNRRLDYTLQPENLGSLGDLAAGEGVLVTVDFSPRSGGPKDATIEIDSSDPDEGAVFVTLTGTGDGPKVCPDPFPSVDFGQVEINTTSSIDVTLSNCGTLAMELLTLETQNGTGTGPSSVYTLGAATPARPIALAAGADAVVPVEFRPASAGVFTGRLYLESTDPVVPSGWVTLVGEGVVPPSCQLQTSTNLVSFGQGAPTSVGGVPVTKTIALSNPGQLDCTGVTAAITAGAGIRFSITGFPAAGPPWTLAPGDIVVFTLEYDPQDTTGPDTGTLTFTANEVPAPLDVQLTGTPVATPTCDLKVNPAVGNFQFGDCVILTFTPRVAQFGAVRIAQTKQIPVSIENTGSIACTINSVALKPASFIGGPDPAFTLPLGSQVMVNGALTNTISPGEIGEIPVEYAPTNEVQNCGALWIETSNTALSTECLGFPPGPDGCYNISLMGLGTRSAIQVIPENVDFGLVTVGCASQTRDVSVYNIGGAPMNITSVYIDPPGSPFSIVSSPPTPAAVTGGTSVTIRVQYRPPDTNTHSALLVIESDAQNNAFLTVPLTGQGTTDSHQTDTFQQPSEPKVDVLWVIDDSCSMSEEQSNIASNTATFLARALTLNTDFQLGVTTTDMDDPNKSGRLQSVGGAPKIITRASADPAAEFQLNAVQGTSGSGNEKGLAGAHAALSDPLINDPAANLGFLRPDAKLVIINVSDDDDHAVPPVDFYVDFFKNIKGYRNADLMSFSAVVSPSPTCSGAAAPGVRYQDVAARTGGLERSICSTNWGQLADDLGLDTFGSQSQFFLSREAIDASIVVQVDGSTRPRSGNWSYESASNSVVFEPAAAPGQSATIVIDYDVICR